MKQKQSILFGIRPFCIPSTGPIWRTVPIDMLSIVQCVEHTQTTTMRNMYCLISWYCH